MAYSDYGGYAYRNGELIEERSDAVFTTDGLKSTPGAWPGWTVLEGRNGGSYHVILGDGPIHVCLYKQSSIIVRKNGAEVPLVDVFPKGCLNEWKGEFYHDCDNNELISGAIDGWGIQFITQLEDNYYTYARVQQPDGTVWTGFSGYGIGAGLDDGSYGYSTEDRAGNLHEMFATSPQPEGQTDG